MAGQAPKPDFGQIKCPDCDAVMKPVTPAKRKDDTAQELECPEGAHRLTPRSRGARGTPLD